MAQGVVFRSINCIISLSQDLEQLVDILKLSSINVEHHSHPCHANKNEQVSHLVKSNHN